MNDQLPFKGNGSGMKWTSLRRTHVADIVVQKMLLGCDATKENEQGGN